MLGESQQSVNSLTSLQSVFDISGEAGIAGALNNIFASFSAWAQSPTDTIARQNVIERATDVARAFQQTAGALSNLSQDTDRQLQQTVDEVNRLAGELSQNNYRVMQGARDDAGLNAQMNATLEELSQYTEVTALWQPNGTVSVFMNGQTPLVLEDRKYEIALRPAQPATATIQMPGHRLPSWRRTVRTSPRHRRADSWGRCSNAQPDAALLPGKRKPAG